MLGTGEVGVILVVGAILLFGAPKVVDWAKALGEAKRTYKEASTEEPKGKK
jgi:Sec-independent protein translocase protein TatA